MAGLTTFFDVIEKTDNNFTTIAIFSHNNGITEFANRLAAVRIDNMPTCSIFAVKVHCDNWVDFRKANKEFLFFDYPKAGG
jgi:phosphohistidine phosphatase